MNYLKKIFSKTSETFKSLIKKFPVTLLIVAFATIFATISIGKRIEIFDKTMLFCIIFSVESFFTEVCICKKKLPRIISYIASIIIATCFTMSSLGNFAEKFVNNTQRILIGYLFILFLISVYKIIKEHNINFKEYILKIFANIFNTSITYLFLNIGLTLITAIFVELILNSWGHILGRIQVLLLGLFFTPALINSLWNVKEKEVNVFLQGLVKYVLLPLVTIAMLIIYIYIIKILALRQIPSNMIFRILAGIFIVAFPIWNMAENFKEKNKLIEKVTKILPYLYMPFILLEIYSLYVRVAEFGITPIRYFGVMFIIMQIIALALTVIKKGEKLSQIFIDMAVLVLIAFILPLNYNRVSILSQKSILKSEFPETLEYEELSKESKQRVYGAYTYLVKNNGAEYIPEYVKQHKNEIYNETYYQNEKNNTETITFNSNKNELDISKYSKLVEIKRIDYEENFKNEKFIKELVRNAMDSEDAKEYIENHNLIKIDEETDCYIKYLSAEYNKDTNELVYIYINGYFLYR